MKYEEMIKEIINILKDENHKDDQEKQAQSILEMQVALGMLPPEYEKKIQRDLGSGLVVEFNKTVREWEEVKPS